jgi:nitrile hydratase
MRADAVWDFLHDRSHSRRHVDEAPRFAVGQRVRARTMQPTGHTRLPRYARGKTGIIVSHHGGHVLPDASAHGKGDSPQHLYTVRFTARELWGEAANPRDSVHLDLWESYLEPA